MSKRHLKPLHLHITIQSYIVFVEWWHIQLTINKYSLQLSCDKQLKTHNLLHAVCFSVLKGASLVSIDSCFMAAILWRDLLELCFRLLYWSNVQCLKEYKTSTIDQLFNFIGENYTLYTTLKLITVFW